MNTSQIYGRSLYELEPLDGVTIVAFGHKCRQGKDTAADILIDKFGSRARRFAFADALKAHARIDYGMTRKDGNTLQAVGNKVREQRPQLWESLVYWAIEEARPEIAIVTDMRHLEEAQFMRHLGAKLIKIQRFNTAGHPYRDPTRDQYHVSEVQLDHYQGWDAIIDNMENNLDQFRTDLLATMKKFGLT